MKTNWFVLLGMVVLTACSSHSVDIYSEESPQLNVRDFFNGEVTAWGIVQDRRGRVINRFQADLVGTWDGANGVLDEDFYYADGEYQFRQWRLVQVGENQYEGYADDVIGTGYGTQSGNAFNLKYELIVPLSDGDEVSLKFDDWMWLMEGGVIINRATMRKFGFKVGELTVVMQKQ